MDKFCILLYIIYSLGALITGLFGSLAISLTLLILYWELNILPECTPFGLRCTAKRSRPSTAADVSRVHCTLTVESSNLYICDEGSTYGTYLRLAVAARCENGTKPRRALLSQQPR